MLTARFEAREDDRPGQPVESDSPEASTAPPDGRSPRRKSSKQSKPTKRRPGREKNRRKLPRGLGLLVLILLGCMSGVSNEHKPVAPSEAAATPLEANELGIEQRRSLTYVFYRGNAAPPKPSARELRRLDHNLAAAPRVEVDELRGLYGDDDELLAYASRDTDRDGVLDYRISHYCGKFFEGDIDLDGDGIRNVYDVAPYDRRVGGVDTNRDGAPDKPGSFADADGDKIPDHIDWSTLAPEQLSEQHAEQQAGLFRDFGVMLVERSSSFTPELVQAIDDTMRLVFRKPLPTLRTMAVEDQLLLSRDLGDNGLMVAQTQTLTVYTKSITNADPLVVLGLLVHEVDHAWQLGQDFDANDLRAENTRIHYPPGKFAGSIERFGWVAEDDTLGEVYHHRLYWPHFYATSPRYLYRGSPPNEWAAWFEDVERESGRDFLRNSPAVTWGMVGPYSLTSPWEWHADQLMASVYNRIDRGIGTHHNHAYRDIASLLRVRMLQSVRGQWYRYDYRNAAGTSIDRALAQQFELTPIEIETLIDRYVVPLADLPMLSKALGLDSESLGADKLSESLEHGWMQLREGMVAPLEQAPRLQALVQLGMVPWRDAGTQADQAEGEPSDAMEEAGETDEVGEADPTAEPVPDEEEPAASEAVPAPDRGGAGRVGGVVPDEDEPAEGVLPAGELDPSTPEIVEEHDEQPDRPAEAEASERRSHGVADPVFRLLDRLRETGHGLVVPAEDPATEP
jgi:hypothetical protein